MPTFISTNSSAIDATNWTTIDSANGVPNFSTIIPAEFSAHYTSKYPTISATNNATYFSAISFTNYSTDKTTNYAAYFETLTPANVSTNFVTDITAHLSAN